MEQTSCMLLQRVGAADHEAACPVKGLNEVSSLVGRLDCRFMRGLGHGHWCCRRKSAVFYPQV